MISSLGNVKVYVWTQPIDFRKGMDGLLAIVVSQLGMKPFSGAIFIFRSRRADRLKMIFWDGSGVVLVLKRLEDRAFTWPTATSDALTLSMRGLWGSSQDVGGCQGEEGEEEEDGLTSCSFFFSITYTKPHLTHLTVLRLLTNDR